MVLAEVGDGAEVGSVIRCHNPKGDILLQPLLYLPGGRHPHAVSIQQHLHHHPWMVGWVASFLVCIAVHDGR